MKTLISLVLNLKLSSFKGNKMFENAWRNFKPGAWQKYIDVRAFIVKNYTPYDGSEDFLVQPSIRTKKLWDKCKELLREEYLKSGVLDIDTNTVSGITAYPPGYIDKDCEVIKGLQTDSPLKRAVNPFGGIRMAKQACERYNRSISSEIDKVFTKFCRTHNDGVYSCYTPEMRRARKCGVVTGLPMPTDGAELSGTIGVSLFTVSTGSLKVKKRI